MLSFRELRFNLKFSYHYNCLNRIIHSIGRRPFTNNFIHYYDVLSYTKVLSFTKKHSTNKRKKHALHTSNYKVLQVGGSIHEFFNQIE